MLDKTFEAIRARIEVPVVSAAFFQGGEMEPFACLPQENIVFHVIMTVWSAADRFVCFSVSRLGVVNVECLLGLSFYVS